MTNMHHYRLDKLVRDKAVANMEDDNADVTYRALGKGEFCERLGLKLQEESLELAQAIKANNSADIKDELADVMEIIIALAAANNISSDELEQTRKDRAQKRGSFDKALYVEQVACPIGSFFDIYFDKDHQKYGKFEPKE